MLMRIDVRLTEQMILKHIRDNERITHAELAALIGCSIRTVERHTPRLEAQGLITSKRVKWGKVYVINQQ